MSDEGPTLSEVQRQFEELRRQIGEVLRLYSALEARLEAGSRTAELSAGSSSSARWDRYDRPVIDKLEEGETYDGIDLVHLYERLTAMQDAEKIKSRAKRLHESELFDGETFVGEGDPGSNE